MQITKNQTHPRKSGHSHHQYLQHHNKLPYEAHKERGKKEEEEEREREPKPRKLVKREERERENRNQTPKPNGKRKEKRGEKKNKETKPRPSVKKKKVMMSGLGRTQKIKEQSKKKSQVWWERREPLESQVDSQGFDNTQNMGPISWVKLRKCHYNSNFITLFFLFFFLFFFSLTHNSIWWVLRDGNRKWKLIQTSVTCVRPTDDWWKTQNPNTP